MVENSLRTALFIPRLVGWLVLISILGAANTSWAHTMAKVESDLKASDRNLQLVEQPAPEFTLQGFDGAPIALSDWRGRVVVLNFVYMRCRDSCPSHSQTIAKAQALVAQVPGLSKQVQFVTIATDTENARSSVDLMQTYGVNNQLDMSNWMILYGGPEDAQAGIEVAKKYGIEFVQRSEGEQMQGVVTHVIDTSGQLRAKFHGVKFNQFHLMTYAAALAHGEHAKTGSSSDRTSPSIDQLPRQLILGVVFAAISIPVFAGWTWFRRKRDAVGARKNLDRVVSTNQDSAAE